MELLNWLIGESSFIDVPFLARCVILMIAFNLFIATSRMFK